MDGVARRSGCRHAVAGVVVLVAVVAGSTVAGPVGGAPPDTTVTVEQSVPTASEEFVIPADYRVLVDDTIHLTIAVPDTWTDIVTAPDTIDGAVVPQINAATDLDVWRETFDAPGVLYAAYPFTDDNEALYSERFEPAAQCAANDVVDYNDGAFVGRWWRHTGCGPAGQAERHIIVASPASEAATVAVVVQLASPQDQAVLDVVLQSFNFTPTATWPVPADTPTASTSTTTLSPQPLSTATPIETTRVENASGLMSVSVPTSWTPETLGTLNDDGSVRPTIVAAADLEEFRDGFDTPGIRVFALPPVIDVEGLLANVEKPDDCESTGPVPFDNGELVGVSQTWTSCAGGTTNVAIVAARPADDAFNLFARVHEEVGAGMLSTIIESLAIDNPTVSPVEWELPDVTPEGAVPASLWKRPAGVDTVLVVDRLRQIKVSVPSFWQDVLNDPLMHDDGTGRPLIVASPHIETMLDQVEMPGLIFHADPYVEPEVYLANILVGYFGCPQSVIQSFDNGDYHGLMHTSSGCDGPDGPQYVRLVVSPSDNSATLYLEVQLPTDDDTALQIVLSSFGQL